MERNYLMSYRLHIVATRLFTLLTIGVLTIVCPDFAYSGYVKVGDLYYTTDDDNMTAKVTYEKYQNYSNYSGLTSVHIPSSINVNGKVYKVKAVEDYAFYRAKD